MRSIRQETALLEKLQAYVLKNLPVPRDGRTYVEMHFMDGGAPIAFDPERYSEMSLRDLVECYAVTVRNFTLYATNENREGIPAWEYSYNGVLLGIIPK